MEVKLGYKQTEVGVIPEDWDSLSIKDILAKNGGSVKTGPFGTLLKANEYSSEGVPVISVGEVGYGEIKISENTPYVPSSVVKRLREYVLQSGDIVFGRKGAVDRSAMVQPHQEGWFLGSDGIRLRLGKEIHPKFVSYQLQNDSVKNWLFANAIGTTMASLNQEILKQVILSIPPLPEQTAIATALSDVDALISGLDRLIEKKRAIKQAAMQELLTGKRRLPGFDSGKGYKQTEIGEIPEDWEVNKIGQISVIDPENLPGNTDPNYTFNYISLEDVDYGRLLSFKELIFSDSPSRARRKMKQGDILFSTVRPNLKSHLFFSSTSNRFICSTGFSVVRCDEKLINPKYVYFHLFGTIIEKQIDALITGSNYPAINSTDVKSMNLPIPPLPEQTSIATVLSDMDAEISALETRRAKTISLKQGMMQELLTGRIRLV